MAHGRNGKSRIYWRDRGGAQRAYGDFRDYADAGGGREALVPRGAKLATTDGDVAQKLAQDRVAQLEQLRRGKAILGLAGQAALGPYAEHHLVQKARAGRVTDRVLVAAERHLQQAVDFFGTDRLLDTISVADVETFRNQLATIKTRRKSGTLGPGTQRHILNDLSNLYRRAGAEGLVPPGYNPVAAMMDKPIGRRQEARWLEVHDAALLLESARTWEPPFPGITNGNMYAILATFMLTGGRMSEVLGLAVTDVSFDRGTVTFRPNEYRRLKTRTSHRSVPLWPQLKEILRDYLFGQEEPLTGLLFPSKKNGGMIWDVRKALDAIAKRAGWAEGEVRTKAFRHTYCAARLQTTDRGQAVATFTVARELGHSGEDLVRKIYGHLGDVRHRTEIVEYRIAQHRDVLGDRLKALRG